VEKATAVARLNMTVEDPFYREMVNYDGKVYISPGNEDFITVFDTESKSISQIPIQTEYAQNVFSALVLCNCFAYNGFIFFSGMNYGAIVRLDPKDNSLTYYPDFVEKLAAFPVLNNNVNNYISGYCVDGNMFYGVTQITNALIVFNLDNFRTDIIKIGDYQTGFRTVSSDGKYLWLSAVKLQNSMIRIDPKTLQVDEIGNFPAGFRHDRLSILDFVASVEKNGYIWLFPQFCSNMVIKINTKTEETSCAEDLSHIEPNYRSFTVVQTYGEKIFAPILTNNKSVLFHIINSETGDVEIKRYACEIPPFEKIHNNVSVVYEYPGLTLNDLLDIVSAPDYKSKSFRNNMLSRGDEKFLTDVGKKIVDYVLNCFEIES
jgi:hypothetical protein